MNIPTEWTRSPLDTRTSIRMNGGSHGERVPFASVGELNLSNCTVTDFRSKRAVEDANKIVAYSLTKDVE